MVIAYAVPGTQIDHPVLMVAALLYVIPAILWLWLRGMGEPSTGRDLLIDRAVLIGLFVAVGIFLALMVTGVRNP